MNPNVINIWLSMRQLLESMPAVQESDVSQYTDQFISMFKMQNPDFQVDRDQVIAHAKQELGIGIEKGQVLIGDKDQHIYWLNERGKNIDWKFWSRYRRYLLEVRHLPARVITNMDELSMRILDLLEDPQRPGPWDRRGMVVGNVQSGKTGNYIGLINRALDSGYKLIIVLAGIHNSLRSQTQWRIDEGVTGINTNQKNALKNLNTYFGVMNLKGEDFIPINPVTTSLTDGDFIATTAKALSIIPHKDSDPIILVIKKNGSALDNVKRWLDWATTSEVNSISVPTLVIDDEADYASINTKALKDSDDEDIDPTAINRKIRTILNKCERSAYIGYTATPFANIFITEDDHSEYGEDLFPRSFIINLPSPSNYIGPARIFGLQPTNDMPLMEEVQAVDIMCPIDDYAEIFPDKHKSDLDITELPKSLIKAIHSFILATSVRRARGQFEHNSMLVHVTRFVRTQNQVYKLIEEERLKIKEQLIGHSPDHSRSLVQTLKKLWEDDFEKQMLAIQNHPEISDIHMTAVQWAEVAPQILGVIEEIKVRSINGTSGDVLDYFEHPKGLTVIAIGGDKLSRGLTLEGLTVSYYLRASRMYDTLMQMGRWFGYRPGYLDVCRLFTTSDLISWYEQITLASEELRSEFEKMVNSGGTPREYGLKVRTSPEGLQVSATNKMRSSTKMRVSFGGALIQNVAFAKDTHTNANNFRLTESFIHNLQAGVGKKGSEYIKKKHTHLWLNMPVENVLEFLQDYSWHPRSPRSKPGLLMQYIKQSNDLGELIKWNISLISRKPSQSAYSVNGLPIGLLERKDAEEDDSDAFILVKQNLYSPTDEFLDLSEGQYSEALQKTRSSWELTEEAKNKNNPERTPGKCPNYPSGHYIREARSASTGYLMLYPLDNTYNPKHEAYFEHPIMGYALSFPPTANKDNAVDYQVNEVYYRRYEED